MKTPITDKFIHSLPREYDWSDACCNRSAVEDFARRLELDRAALMEALEDLCGEIEEGNFTEDPREIIGLANKSMAALAAARANFPEP